MKNKKFRLFISSTFNDFKREREVLQTKVFPHIKKYASKLGFTFQPIDLRWGVSNEAQLDQKTLNLCLSEVRECKTHIHPNFLIMVGDRYGWVPLPNAIEKVEYEALISNISQEKEKQLLTNWYELDENQIPPFFILKERKGEYIDNNNWIDVEDKLRTILQTAISNSKLETEQKRKYFLSATEAEVEEGIIPYIAPTPFQEKVLLSKDRSLEALDPEHVFGFFRYIEKATKIKNKYIHEDYNEAQDFKKRVKSVLPKENILQIKTSQVDQDNLEQTYLQEYERRIIKFLESQLEIQNVEEEITTLQLELRAQEEFSSNLRKGFLHTEPLKILLSSIHTYINNDTRVPLVIHGVSGSGKSSLMAKAIEYTRGKVIYRFIGASPNSKSSKEVLMSIFDELGVNLRAEVENHQAQEITSDHPMRKDHQESFEGFSYRVRSELNKLRGNVVIFIDAVDQLNNHDQFLWLPENLISNVKIILSALNDDENYKKDSQYFKALNNREKINTIEIPTFNQPLLLLNNILKKENRTITNSQENYFLQQFATSGSPLYVTLAAQEIKNWKSTDTRDNQNLETTNEGIILEFINNLSCIYHHDERFVKKVLGYIYASRYGLSESELLQLIEIDKEFVKLIADDKFHKNSTLELPLVHWSRLYTQLKPFLSTKVQDGEEIMYFFHREFETVIEQLENQEKEHKAIIEATKKLLIRNQDQKFNTNRWGKLFVTIVVHQREIALKKVDQLYIKAQENGLEIFFGDNESLIDKVENTLVRNAIFIVDTMKDESLIKNFSSYTSFLRIQYSENMIRLHSILEFNHLLMEYAIGCNKDLSREYCKSMSDLAYVYKNMADKFDESISLGDKAVKIAKHLYLKSKNKKTAEDYAICTSNLCTSYEMIHNDLDSINKFSRPDDLNERFNILNKIVDLRIEIYDISKEYLDDQTLIINALNLIISLKNLGEMESSLERFQRLCMAENVIDELKLRIECLESKNNLKHIISTFYSNAAVIYKSFGQKNDSKAFYNKALKMSEFLYSENTEKWINLHLINSYNLMVLYKEYDFDELYLQAEVVKILSEKHGLFDSNYYRDAERILTPYTLPVENEQVMSEDLIIDMLNTLRSQSEAESATFNDLLLLSKYVAIVKKEEEISINSFAGAFGFIEFNENAKTIFSQIVDLDIIKSLCDSQLCIEHAENAPEVPFSIDLEKLIVKLNEIFNGKFIGKLR